MAHDDENGQENQGAKLDERDGSPALAGLLPRMAHDHGIGAGPSAMRMSRQGWVAAFDVPSVIFG